MAQADSIIRLYPAQIRRLNRAIITALEQAAEAVHTDVVQAQVIPFDNGTLQQRSTFVDTSQSENGHVSLVSSTPYARRLYFHPEYDFDQSENPNAKGRWFEDYLLGGDKQEFAHEKFAEILRRELGE